MHAGSMANQGYARVCPGLQPPMFLGHHANKGCSRCLKSFPKVDDSLDYSGFEQQMAEENKFHPSSKGIQNISLKKRKRIESENGARFCILFELPYYDAIRFTAIDVISWHC